MARYEHDHTHGARGEFKSGFKLTMGVLFALLFFFVGLPILLCAGCSMGFIGLSGKATHDLAEEAKRKADAAAKANAPQQPEVKEPKPVQPPKPKPLAVGDVVKLEDASGFIPIAETEVTLDLFLKAEADKKEGIMMDFLIAETVTRTQSGSEAKILELGAKVVKVTLVSGPHKGKTGYVSPAAIPGLPQKK